MINAIRSNSGADVRVQDGPVGFTFTAISALFLSFVFIFVSSEVFVQQLVVLVFVI